ncbi:class I SAM-dependent methyltransferase [Saccharicrinis aurantiacus]|uniref:class I SAM-dependent methyltransferase n=1 Tax=Saccharicrinis aurantiacus TaxID=1849719 RepID=UPI000838B972|nr:class I SAM-dependent methyltransferase [Saccharicrinis aurantiacus]
MTDIEYIIDFHLGGKRQGPGSDKETLKALSFIDIANNKDLSVADVGSGTGAQTISIANNIDGRVLAVDLFPQFLDKVNENANKLGLQDKVLTMEASMDKLPFITNEFDILWSEGAIYNIGFENGLRKWKPFIKEGGYVAVTEISWLSNNRPSEVHEFWTNAYPEIDTISNKTKVIEENGYSPVAHFILPNNCWLDNYYNPMEERFSSFLEKHANSKAAKAIIDGEQKEIELYKKYGTHYGYVFYIAKRI